MTPKKQPLRQCTGCGEMFLKRDLVRIVKTPEETIMLDRSGKLNGRGAYICRNPECYKKAVKAKRLERYFSMPIPESVSEQILKELASGE